MMYLLLSVLVVSLVGLVIPSAFAENVPDWVKNTAGWWASDQITDSAFLQGIQYLIKEGIMVIPPTEASESVPSQEVPDWVKNTAGWWAQDAISETEFVNAVAYLIKIGNMYSLDIVEPLAVKEQIIKSATEAACMILRIDDVIAVSGGPSAGGPPPGMPPMG